MHFEGFLQELFGKDFTEIYKKNAMARLDILKHFEMLKRKFNPGVEERSRLCHRGWRFFLRLLSVWGSSRAAARLFLPSASDCPHVCMCA